MASVIYSLARFILFNVTLPFCLLHFETNLLKIFLQNVTLVTYNDTTFYNVSQERSKKMSSKRWIILGIVIICGFVLGRLAFRSFLNLMLGGTMFGGNIL